MKLFLLTCVLAWINQSQGLNILVVVGDHKSHMMYLGSMARALAAEGHNVTAVVGSNMKILPDFSKGDIKWLQYATSEANIFDAPELAEKILQVGLGEASRLEGMRTLMSMMEKAIKLALELYDDTTLVETLKRSNFDFAVVDSTILPLLILPHLLDIPFANMQVDADTHQQRIPVYPSYVPTMITGYSDKMTFVQRVTNFAIYAALFSAQGWMLSSKGLEDYARIIPDKPPVSYYNLASDASLFFTLRVPGLHTVRGSMPHMLDVGGVMGRPANLSNINADLATFIHKSSPNGFIIVSFGSMFDPIPEHLVLKLLTAFSSIEQSVIWKMAQAPKEHYPNIKFVRWIPQNDLLGHPMIRAFLTHCGGSSILETTYHGVPIIGLPIGLDQPPNANLMKNRNYGIVLDLQSFTVEELVSAINSVSNPAGIYAENIRKASSIFKDLPHAGKTASFWIQHVVQHGRDHMRSVAFDMVWYQYYSLDVIAVLCLAAVVGCKLMLLTLSLCCRKCCRRKIKTE